MPASEPFDVSDLVADVEPDQRESRRRLLDRLIGDGVGEAEIRDAAAAGSLPALVAGHRVSGSPLYTESELSALTGIDLEYLVAVRRASGLPVHVSDGRPGYFQADLDTMRDIQRFRDAGFSDERLLEVTRVLGRSMSQTAEAIRQISMDLVSDARDEEELALRWAMISEQLLPLTGPMVERVLRLHLREVFGREVFANEDDETLSPESRFVAIAFADLVGFTRLGEELPPYELSRLSDRLVEMSEAVVTTEVRFVKAIGDAVMLVANDVDPLLEALLTLVDAADDESATFPQLRAGIAYGNAVNRHGDWFGRAVNRASRITALARPGSVLVTESAHDAATAPWTFRSLPPRRIKGVADNIQLFRARWADAA